jgi:thiamine biosynthesis lipoprotein
VGFCLVACGTLAMSSVAAGVAPGAGADALVERERFAMGTMFRVVARTSGSATETRRAIDAALDEVVRLDRVLSHYDERSDLSRLAREGVGRFVAVHPDLYEVVTRALDVSRRSAGRFDVTVGPLVRAWQAAREQHRRPTDDELARAAACVGHEKIVVRPPDSLQLRSDCMSLDLGAIGKGYAVDRAIEVLQAHGVAHAVVNGGGSTIKAMGTAPARDGWPVQPYASEGTDEVVVLRDAALSTSQQHAEVVEPGTRSPVRHAMTVTVVAGSATLADAVSTALLLSTVDEGRAMLRDLDGVAASWSER